MMTKDQIDFFNIFGFIKFPGLFKEDIGWITEEFHKVFDNANVLHTGEKPSNVDPFIDKSAKLATLIYDKRIEGICTALLGDKYNYMNSDGKIFMGETLWHRDGLVQDKYKFIKIGFYLDQVDGETGALRVIPGSHKLQDAYSQALGTGSFVNGVKNAKDPYWGVPGNQLPAYTLDSVPGDIVIFSHQMMHSSWGGGKSRRMFAISLCEELKGEGIGLLEQYMAFSPSKYSDILINESKGKTETHLEQGLEFFNKQA